MIAWPVAAAREAGRRAHHRRRRARAPARRAPATPDVEIAVQHEPNGTGDAVAAAADRSTPSDPVIVLSGDVPLVTADAIQRARRRPRRRSAPPRPSRPPGSTTRPGYGRVVRGADGSVERVAETKVARRRDGRGARDPRGQRRHLRLRPRALFGALPQLSADNAQGEYYLPDVLPSCCARAAAVAAHELDDPAIVLGVNDRVDLAHVRALMHAAHHRGHQLAGVTSSTRLHLDRRRRRDRPGHRDRARHLPARRDRDRRRLPSSARGTTAHRRDDRRRRDGRALLPDRARGRDGASVGPFAYLRPGRGAREGAKVGTFVEIKNSDIGAGAKVPHLSYIGDADVGEGTNLGAGTITANYDGTNKHRTTIGARRSSRRRHHARRPRDCRRRRLHRSRMRHHRGRAADGLWASRARDRRTIEDYDERASGGR